MVSSCLMTTHPVLSWGCLLSGPSLNTYFNWYFVLKPFLLWPTLPCQLHRLSALGPLISSYSFLASRDSHPCRLSVLGSWLLVLTVTSTWAAALSGSACVHTEKRKDILLFLFGGSRLFLQSHIHTHIHIQSTLAKLQRTNYACSTCRENVLKRDTHIT